MADTWEITTRVDAEAAKAYAVASVEESKKLDLLMILRLSHSMESPDSLEQAMRETSKAVWKRGVTETNLDELLHRV